MTDLDVHPVADLFPMLAPDELTDLAADIAERGLLHPVVLDTDGRVLDGRNRLAACELAEVEPEFVTYDGDDPAGYALAVNIARRHLTKGQQAAVIARSLPVSGNTQAQAASTAGLSQQRVGQAVVVRDFAPELVDAVIAGAVGLDAAYTEARKRKTAADSETAQLERLRTEDPELADRVVEGDLSLKAAWVEREERRQEDRRKVDKAVKATASIVTDFEVLVSTIAVGAQLSDEVRIDKPMVTALRNALDILEGLL